MSTPRSKSKAAASTQSGLGTSTTRPFQLERIDHIVIRCHDFPTMFDFYTRVLGCTIDEPTVDFVNRFGGALTHLRAGSCYIDLLAYDTNHLTEEGKLFAARSYAGGAGIGESMSIDDVCFSSDSSTLDHLCIRIEPFDETIIKEYFMHHSVSIVAVGDERLGADGVGPSVYVRDPEGNIIELKGKPNSKNNNESSDDKFTTAKQSNRHSAESNHEINPRSVVDELNSSTGHSSTAADSSKQSHQSKVIPITPCNRICRYNNSFYGGQVCIGCFRDEFEIKMWQSMTPYEKSITLLDAIDRCSFEAMSLSSTSEEKSNESFDGAVTVEELTRQYNHWAALAKESKRI